MKLRITAILFLLSLLAYIFGDRTVSFSIHENHYILSFMQIILILLIIITGIQLLVGLNKTLQTEKNN